SYDIQVVFARGARPITAAVQGKQRSVKQADNNRAQHVHAFTPRDATHRHRRSALARDEALPVTPNRAQARSYEIDLTMPVTAPAHCARVLAHANG
ncbi:hypothetical protein, partial [Xanthomonas campestris]